MPLSRHPNRTRAAKPQLGLGLIGTALLSAVAGCFYVDPINSRPSVAIARLSEDTLVRGGRATFAANRFDENEGGDSVVVQWQAFVCGQDQTACDATPFVTSIEPTVTFDIPAQRQNMAPTEKLLLRLTGRDTFGAEARPEAVQVYDVGNGLPKVTALQAVALPSFTVGLPLELRMRMFDPDDALATLSVDWTVFPAAQSTNPALIDVPQDPTRPAEQTKRLIPDVPGTWSVVVRLADPVGGKSERVIDVAVERDHPPCLALLMPEPAPLVAALDQLTTFQVLAVTDDLDPLPGAAASQGALQWSIKSRLTDGERVPLVPAEPTAVALDPAGYQPGDVIELRVEATDRVARPLTCTDAAPQCSLDTNQCLQRQTWRLEVR